MGHGWIRVLPRLLPPVWIGPAAILSLQLDSTYHITSLPSSFLILLLGVSRACRTLACFNGLALVFFLALRSQSGLVQWLSTGILRIADPTAVPCHRQPDPHPALTATRSKQSKADRPLIVAALLWRHLHHPRRAAPCKAMAPARSRRPRQQGSPHAPSAASRCSTSAASHPAAKRSVR